MIYSKTDKDSSVWKEMKYKQIDTDNTLINKYLFKQLTKKFVKDKSVKNLQGITCTWNYQISCFHSHNENFWERIKAL